jgi:hypothetical protein
MFLTLLILLACLILGFLGMVLFLVIIDINADYKIPSDQETYEFERYLLRKGLK